jgi:hypothetical protein
VSPLPGVLAGDMYHAPKLSVQGIIPTGRTETSTGGGFPGACVGEHNGQQNASEDAEVGVPQGVGQSGTQAGSQGSTWSGRAGPGLYTSVTNDEWEAPRWEQIIPRPIAAQLSPLSTTDRRHQTRMQDKLRDQQCASRWCNKRSTQASVQIRWGSAAHRATLVPTILQIRAAAVSSGLDTHPNKADSVWFTAAAETIYEARAQEEVVVRDLLEQ